MQEGELSKSLGPSQNNSAAQSCEFTFELNPTWQKSAADSSNSKHLVSLSRANASHESLPLDMFAQVVHDPWDELISKHVVGHPTSGHRNVWIASSIALICYDLVVIPLQFFDLSETTFIVVMAWLTRMFWTFDVLVSFTTGYVKDDGTVEMDFHQIARSYLFTWFTFDATLVAVDWMEVGVTWFGVFRFIRGVRLLRFFRVHRVMNQCVEHLYSETLTVMVDIMRITIVIAGFAHIIACTWYGIGSSVEGSETWVDHYGMPEKGFSHQYSAALHYSLAQFAGGMDEFAPQNLQERLFAIAAFVLGFVLSSIFVSSLTSSMTQLHMITSNNSQKLIVLRKYLNQTGITKELIVRVQRSAKHSFVEQQHFMPEEHVDALRLVSEPLRIEVHFEMYTKVLQNHPFFTHYIHECPQVMRKVCNAALGMHLVSRSDVIFHPGEMPQHPKMFFLCNGTLRYVTTNSVTTSLEPNEWVAEPVLWIYNWMHQGTLVAKTDCRLCTLDAQRFQEIVGRFAHSFFNPRSYAADFVALVNNKRPEELTDLVNVNDIAANLWCTRATRYSIGRSLSSRRHAWSIFGNHAVTVD